MTKANDSFAVRVMLLATSPARAVDAIRSLIRASLGLHKLTATAWKVFGTPICTSKHVTAYSILGGVEHLGVGRT